MAGTPADKFRDFMEVTGPAYLTGADTIINEAVKRRYLWGDLVKGKERAIQGGTEIRETLMTSDGATFQYYQPNETFTWSNPQVLDTVSADWRFAVDHLAWTDHEVELNAGEGLSKDALKTAYKRLKRAKEQRMTTSLVNGLEESLWASPWGQVGEMESSSGKTPYSIPAFITENGKTIGGEFKGYTPTAAGAWTTVAGIDPDLQAVWGNQIVFYDRGMSANATSVSKSYEEYHIDESSDTTHNVFGLITAFDEMFLKLDFRPPSTNAEYFENASMNQQKICCSRVGINEYKRALRDSNDRLVSMQDAAYSSPAYSGIPLTYCSQLDTAALYNKDAAGDVPDTYAGRETEADIVHTTLTGGTEFDTLTIDKGARYYWINGEYLTPFVHSRRYMVKHDVMRHPNQPFTNIQPTDTWWNLLPSSRMRHGIVAPRRTT
tara:strand:+ start:3815 stop:5119 length:1305 start_codon:yes stop_codon:yes gene_type:complete